MATPSRSAFEPAPVLDALLALLPLDSLPRTGWVLRGVEPAESIAGHILGTAHLALAMAPRVDERLDLGRVLAMALVHDAPEAASGDLPRPAAALLPNGAKAAMEAAIAAETIAPLSGAAADAWSEYAAQATPEARFVKSCDRLQMGIQWLGYHLTGRGSALAEFAESLARADFSEFACLEELRAEILRRR